MVAWLDLLADCETFSAKLEKLKAAPGSRKVVSIRHVAEAESDDDWLAQPQGKLQSFIEIEDPRFFESCKKLPKI